MPFASCRRPSIQLGLLAAVCRRAGHPTTTHHLNADFAARLDPSLYEYLSDNREEGLGDWLFSVAAFGPDAPDPEGLFATKLAPTTLRGLSECGCEPERLVELRGTFIHEWLDEVVVEVLAAQPDVVGFTCTFEQTVASVALAARLKAARPECATVFGGANFDYPMGVELVRTMPGIDLALCGEADQTLPALLDQLAEGKQPSGIPGLVRGGAPSPTGPPGQSSLVNLELLPTPDYDEYFSRMEQLGLLSAGARREVDLPYESARGCWWGERMHCTFCGLNGTTMAFRSKSPAKVLAELAELTARYRSFRIEVVDNILDKRYIDEVFPVMADAGWSYSMFYEIKADVRPTQLRQLRRAGVDRVQPGIESLSSDVLRLMRKGTRAAQNLMVLRTARSLEMDVSWNMLWGFPGELPSYYDDQARLVPALLHLQPPRGWGRIWLERFSPLFEESPQVVDRQPQTSYEYSYPTGVDLDEVAYFFHHRTAGELAEEQYLPLVEALEKWRAAWQEGRPTLALVTSPRLVQVDDNRDPRHAGTFVLEPPLSDLLMALQDVPMTQERLVRHLPTPIPGDRVTSMVGDLIDAGLVVRDGPLLVGVATARIA